VILAVELTPFHIAGGVLALWAVVVTALGLAKHSFPGPRGARIVIAISALLVAATIAAAVLSSAEEQEEGEGEHGDDAAAQVR